MEKLLMKMSLGIRGTDRISSYVHDGIDPRRRQEMKDSRMIREDVNAMANLPETPIHREFNQNAFNQSPWSDDEVTF